MVAQMVLSRLVVERIAVKLETRVLRKALMGPAEGHALPGEALIALFWTLRFVRRRR